jgi:hypothetical protein
VIPPDSFARSFASYGLCERCAGAAGCAGVRRRAGGPAAGEGLAALLAAELAEGGEVIFHTPCILAMDSSNR